MEFKIKLSCESEELSRLWDEFWVAKENLERYLTKVRLEPEVKSNSISGN